MEECIRRIQFSILFITKHRIEAEFSLQSATKIMKIREAEKNGQKTMEFHSTLLCCINQLLT